MSGGPTDERPAVGRVSDAERLRRWRLVLGGGEADGTGAELAGHDVRIDAAMSVVYDTGPGGSGASDRPAGRSGGPGASTPRIVRWLGDIRTYFPTPVVQVMQRDAVERLRLRQLLLEPELLEAVEPDVHLVALLVELDHLLPDETRSTARQVVARVVADLERRIGERTEQAVRGALARSARSRHPRPGDVDWLRTIRANLRHYRPEHRTVVLDRLVGFGRRRRSLAKDVVIALDQSGSMIDSVVHAAVIGSVLARIPALRTTLLAFDTAVTDLTPVLHDPIDVLFGVQLGGGTDIAGVLGHCSRIITRPSETVLVLVTDLFEGGSRDEMRRRVGRLVDAGVRVLVLLALSDDGAPAHDRAAASELRDLGATVVACTPEAFPEVLAAALDG